MNWAWDHRELLADLLGEHALLAFIPLLAGLLVALPVGLLVARSPQSRWPVLALCAFLQAIPALTFFVVLPALLDTKLDDKLNVIVALSLFVFALMTRTISDAVAAVPDHVILAADAMGMSPLRRTMRVEMPVALPAIIAGLRTAAVTCVTLATVAALVGIRGFGTLFTEGYATEDQTQVLVGVAAVVLLCVAVDVLLVRAARVFAPWSKLVPVTR